MAAGAFPAAVGALATSVPLIRDHMLTQRERDDLAELLTCMETMQIAKEAVKLLKTVPYWEMMQELDKVAVHRLRDELRLSVLFLRSRVVDLPLFNVLMLLLTVTTAVPVTSFALCADTTARSARISVRIIN